MKIFNGLSDEEAGFLYGMIRFEARHLRSEIDEHSAVYSESDMKRMIKQRDYCESILSKFEGGKRDV